MKRQTKGLMIWLTVFLFLLLFRPSIIRNIDLIYPLTVFSIAGIVYYSRKHRYRLSDIIPLKSIRKYLRWVAIFSIWIIFAFGLNAILSDSMIEYVIPTASVVAKLALTFVCLPLNVIFILMVCKAQKIDEVQLLKLLLYATLIQVVLAVLCYIFPEIHNSLTQIYFNNNPNERLMENNAGESRMFGFAKSLFDTFGYGMGLLAAVPIILAHKTGKMRYLICLPLIFFTIIINARTGLVILALTLIMMLPVLFFDNTSRKRSSKISALLVPIIIVISLFYSYNLFILSDSDFSNTTQKDIESYISYIQNGGDVGDSYGQAQKLFSDDFWTFPDNSLSMTLGAGHSVYGTESTEDFASDVGYTNMVWTFGILGTALLTIVVSRLYWYGMYGREKLQKILGILLIISTLVFQVKGSALWSANLGISVSLMLVLFNTYYSNHGKKIEPGRRRNA